MSQVWPKFFSEFSRYLPLTSILWKPPANSKPPKTIDSIAIDFKPFSSDVFARKTVLTNHLLPSCHLLIVACDDTETYKGAIRKQIKDWLEVVNRKKTQECLIIFASASDSQKSNKFAVNLRTSVFDKLKADFGGKTVKCVQIPLVDNDPSDWYDLLMKLKESVITSFTQLVISLEEEIRKMDLQRIQPGWNFCSFFLVKESLALVYETIGLFDEALLQYDELETIYFQIYGSNSSVIGLNNFGGQDPNDITGNILDFSRKPYRDYILQNTISIFDFRVYLFSRQVHLLHLQGKYVESLKRSRYFIESLFINRVIFEPSY